MQTDTDLRNKGKQSTPRGTFTEWGNVPLHHETFKGENALEVVVGTNVPRGGSAKHGGQTVVILHDAGDTAVEAVRVMTQDAKPCGIVLVVGGDSEARTLADALEFAAQTIKRQIAENHAGQS
jgi:hypothetical protein